MPVNTSGAATSTTPTCLSVANYESSGRYQTNVVGTGAVTMTAADGANLVTGSTANSSANVEVYWLYNTSIFLGSPTASWRIATNTFGTDFTMWFTLGESAATTNHCGFKITRTASGTVNLYASQADGVTETVSSSLTTLSSSAGEDLDLILTMSGSTSVSYYWRKNGGSLSSATTLSTNMPSGASRTALSVTISNNAVATNSDINVFSSSYQR